MSAEDQSVVEVVEELERYADSLYGKLEAERHNHRRDNAHLLKQIEQLRADRQEAIDALRVYREQYTRLCHGWPIDQEALSRAAAVKLEEKP